MDTTIHIVKGYMEYEGEADLRAFTTKAAADAFHQKCVCYERKRPDWYSKRFPAWQSEHPAGPEGVNWHDFIVGTVVMDLPRCTGCGATISEGVGK